MNAGIITFHCSYNFGSALQAYALQTAIDSLGLHAKIIDYRSRDFNKYRILRVKRPTRLLHDLLWWKRHRNRKTAFESFWSSYFNLTRERYSYRNEGKLRELQEEFDFFICGSDQIWNLDCTKGVVKPFFLSFAGDKRRIAYAPSLAHTSFNHRYFDKDLVAGLLKSFDYLSVRELETVPLFQPLVDKKIKVVLDPTLLLESDSYRNMLSATAQVEPYIFVYLLRDCPELIKSAEAMSGRLGMKVYYIAERNLPIPNAINLFGVGPEEFVSLLAHSELVLTNSFHSTVFSILFKKPFRVFATDSSASRMKDLLVDLGLSERCVDIADSSDIDEVNWNTVEDKLSVLRYDSWAYLREALF